MNLLSYNEMRGDLLNLYHLSLTSLYSTRMPWRFCYTFIIFFKYNTTRAE